MEQREHRAPEGDDVQVAYTEVSRVKGARESRLE